MRSNRINVFLMNLLDFRSLLGFLSLSWGKDLEHPVTGYSPLASSLFMNFKLSASWWKWQDSQTDNSLLSACFLSVYGQIPKIITPSASCLYMARFLNWLLSSCLLSLYGSLTDYSLPVCIWPESQTDKSPPAFVCIWPDSQNHISPSAS